MEGCDFLNTASPLLPVPTFRPQLSSLASTTNAIADWIWSQFFAPSLQCDFETSPIKIPDLFPGSLKLSCPGDLLWAIECSRDEAGPVLKPQEALGISTYRPLTPKHVREPSLDQQNCLSNPWKNEWTQPRLDKLPNWLMEDNKNIYCFGPLKLRVFCYAVVANGYNYKEQDYTSELLWLVHWAG